MQWYMVLCTLVSCPNAEIKIKKRVFVCISPAAKLWDFNSFPSTVGLRGSLTHELYGVESTHSTPSHKEFMVTDISHFYIFATVNAFTEERYVPWSYSTKYLGPKNLNPGGRRPHFFPLCNFKEIITFDIINHIMKGVQVKHKNKD